MCCTSVLYVFNVDDLCAIAQKCRSTTIGIHMKRPPKHLDSRSQTAVGPRATRVTLERAKFFAYAALVRYRQHVHVDAYRPGRLPVMMLPPAAAECFGNSRLAVSCTQPLVGDVIGVQTFRKSYASIKRV